MKIYQRNPFAGEWTKTEWLQYSLNIFAKSVCVILQPVLFAVVVDTIWKHFFYQKRHIDGSVHELLLFAFLPIPGLVYAILAPKFIESRQDKLDKLRPLMKRGTCEDYLDFILLAGERLSPISHVLLWSVLSPIILAAMVMDYGIHLYLGHFVVGGITYLLTMPPVIIVEMDSPFSGFWGISRDDAPQWFFSISPRKARRIFFPRNGDKPSVEKVKEYFKLSEVRS